MLIYRVVLTVSGVEKMGFLEKGSKSFSGVTKSSMPYAHESRKIRLAIRGVNFVTLKNHFSD